VSERKIFVILITLLLIFSCKRDYTPKSKAYPRVDYPKKEYQLFDTIAPYRFEYPVYSFIEPYHNTNPEPYWYNIVFPVFDGKIYLSYKNIDHNLDIYIDDSRKLVYKHSIKADAIEEHLIHNDKNDVYGILYDLKGNAASSVQFFVTDSTRHFLRGSLYFNAQPNHDSLAPVIQFVRKDIEHIINTLSWKNTN